VPDFAGLRLALEMFTVAPVKAARINRRIAGSSMAWSPLIGAALAMIAAGVIIVARIVYPGPTLYIRHANPVFEGPLIASALAILTIGLLSRGMHLGGLANTADGLASGRPGEEALGIMRGRPVGAIGVAALIGVLGIDVLALTSNTLVGRGTQALVLGVVAGRVAMLWACTPGLPAADTDGMSRIVVGSVPRIVAIFWTLVLCAGATFYGPVYANIEGVNSAIQRLAAVLVALAVARLVGRHAVRRFGGVTGDVIGACGEVATLTCFLITAMGH
jgi:adenosylcobinamide-GDP ribazoletransferase